MKSEKGDIIETRTKSGLRRYQLEIRHSGLHKYKVIKDDNSYVVKQKAQTEMAHWDQMWSQRQAKEQKAAAIQEKKLQAEERTEEAAEELAKLDNILAHTLLVNDAVDWDSLKNKDDFPEPKPIPPKILPEPKKTDIKYQANLNIVDRLISSKKLQKEQKAEQDFISAHEKWMKRKEDLELKFASDVEEWTQKRDSYLNERDATNQAIDAQKQDYLKGEDAQAIIDYCDLVLSNSEYPDYFPQSYDLDYKLETKLLIIEGLHQIVY